MMVDRDDLDALHAEIERLRAAIRLHRDSREVGTFFDQRLWAALGQQDRGALREEANCTGSSGTASSDRHTPSAPRQTEERN